MTIYFSENGVEVSERYIKIEGTSISLDMVESVKVEDWDDPDYDKFRNYTLYATLGIIFGFLGFVQGQGTTFLFVGLASAAAAWHFYKEMQKCADFFGVYVNTAMRQYEAYCGQNESRADELCKKLQNAMDRAKTEIRV